jgi:hypothetical protein
MPPRPTTLLAVLLLISTAPLPAAGIVENPATPSGGLEILAAEFLWRVGGDDESVLFGQVEAAAVAPDGTTYLLDEQLAEITAVDLGGREIARFGRTGEGPGEMQQPQDVMILGDGRIAILNLRPPKLVIYTPDGTPAGDLGLIGHEGLNFALQARVGPDGLVIQTTRTTFEERAQRSVHALQVMDPTTGEVVSELLSATDERDALGEGGRLVVTVGGGDFLDQWALFPDGSVAIVRDDEVYEIEILGPDGTHRRTIRREAERAPRPREAVEAEIAARRQMFERAGMPFDEDAIERMEPMIVSLHPRPDGELWVLTGSGKATDRPDVVGVFDVLDAAGRFVRQVEIRAPHDAATDRFELSGDALVVFENIVGTRTGFVVMGSTVAQEEPDLEAEPLAIARYRF